MREPISHLDFYLQLSRTERGYRAQVLSSPAGEASADFVAPFSELELENFLLRIGRPRRGTRRIGPPEMEALKTLGKGLHDAVLSGDVRACWSTSVREAEAQNAGLRLRSRIADAPELNNVPWEISLQLQPQPLPASVGIYPAHPIPRPARSSVVAQAQ